MFGLEMTVGSARGGFFLSGKNSNAVTDLTLSCSVTISCIFITYVT